MKPFDEDAQETYGYAISSYFTVQTAVPAEFKSLMYRAHKYFENPQAGIVRGTIKFYRNKQLVIQKDIAATDDPQMWNILRLDSSNTTQSLLIDEIEFPQGFDFDNIHFAFTMKKVWDVAKLDYLKKYSILTPYP